MSQYATPADLAALGLPAAALVAVDGVKQVEFLQSASSTIDSYLRGRYGLPLPGVLEPANTFPPELRDACVAIAAWRLMVYRGVGTDGGEENIKGRHDFYLGAPGMKGWLDKLSAGSVSINAALDATPGVAEGGGYAVDGSTRGFADYDGNGVGEPIGYFWGAPKAD